VAAKVLMRSKAKFKRKTNYAAAVGDTEFRFPDQEEVTTIPASGETTMYEIFTNAVEKHGPSPCLGTRELKERTFENGFEKLTLGDYSWITYEEFGSVVRNFGAGLVSECGMKAKDNVIIFAETSAAWYSTAHSVWAYNATLATVYATLGPEGAAHAINQTRASIVVADPKSLKALAGCVKDCPNLKYVISTAEVDQALAGKITSAGKTLQTKAKIEEAGAAKSVPCVPPTAADLAIIMYTSGTTGTPKGVMLTHANCLAAIAAFSQAVEWKPDDYYLAYLPLAHIMELSSENLCLAHGSKIGYGSPHTLTDAGVKIKTGTCHGDLPTLRPTIFVAAPAVLDKVRGGLTAKIAAAGGLKAKLFKKGLKSANKRWKKSGKKGFLGSPGFWNKLVFKKVQAAMGGRVRVVVSGSAPLSADTQSFMESLFNCPVRQGYGLTETCAAATIGDMGDSKPNHVGGPLSCCHLKLRDWEEGNYLTSDINNPDIGLMRGEVLVGGPHVSVGYYNPEWAKDPELEEKNKTEFLVDDAGMRWFATGDVGQMTPDGTLQIIDRKKDLVKLSKGEYVALSKVENAMKLCPYVENALCYAQGTRDYTMGLVCPMVPVFKGLAASLGKKDMSMEDLCKDADVIAAVLKDMQSACKPKLAAFEIPQKLVLVADPWTPENELLTAAMKLKRIPIVQRHKAEIDAVYV